MGMTGAGKSTFISLVTDQEVVIGNDLNACTQNVTMYRCKFSTSCNIWLIDTPGFDDTSRTDSEVLKEIAGWLAESFSQKVLLNGILYLHRIMDNRMPGSAKRNLFMLKKLCGKDALRNTILVTTMWDCVDPADGDRREKQLITTPEYWGDMIAAGSQTLRHDNTYESAMRLINLYAGSHSTKEKKVLAIQHEMVIEKKALDETDAGKAVEDALIKERSRWRRELDDLREMMKEVLAEKDKESAEMLRQNTAEINAKLAAAERAQRDLKVTMEQMHRERLSAFRRDIEAQRKENKIIREKLSTFEASRDRKAKESSIAPVNSQTLSPLSEELEAQNSKLGAAQAHVQEMEKAHDQGSLDMRGPKYASLLEQLEQHRRELLIVQSSIRGMGQGHGQRYGCDLEPMYSGKLLAQLEGLSM
ncbi:hypothetical protein BO85DRAFT_373411 [Aspergillus piperis CBS 112811]|uniref:G domain-containing protein n=1 Tax=Aspergillus piperis CBS 112811 TaxID=1448313 RepID=A0A8G1R2J4_9EURO|nr:hypothetical protein BO85DRAFT_373411 [Aspergillus piperis CBS 112811]RAH57074.1 hypothetical protein BO85DRAFT_373411 [Aspergillus piperis CBS 112811]